MPIRTILLAVGPSLLIAAAVFAALCRPWSRNERPRPLWAGAVALAAAYVVSDLLVWNGFFGLWPSEEHRRLPLVAIAAAGFVIADSFARGRLRRGMSAWVIGAVLMAPIQFADISRPGTYPTSLVYWFAYAGAVAMLWRENADAARRGFAVRTLMVMGIAAVGASVVLMQHSTAMIAFTAASVAAAAGGIGAVRIWGGGRAPMEGAALVFAALLAGLIAAASFGVAFNVYSAILVLLAAGTAGLGDRAPFRSFRPWAATAACAATSVALLVAAVYFSPKGFDFNPY